MAATGNAKFTPDYEHFLRNPQLRHNVYEPEADTFLFLDGIDAEVGPVMDRLLSRLRVRAWHHFASSVATSQIQPAGASGNPPSREPVLPKPFSAIEIGCGSGLVITHLGMSLQRALIGWCRSVIAASRANLIEEEGVAKEVESACNPLHQNAVDPCDLLIARSVLCFAFGCESAVEGGGVTLNCEGGDAVPLLSGPFADFYFVDINPLALEAARQTWGINLASQLQSPRRGDVAAKADAPSSEATASPPPRRAEVTMLTPEAQRHATTSSDGDGKEAEKNTSSLGIENRADSPYTLVQRHLAAKQRTATVIGSSTASSNTAAVPSSSLFSCTGVLGDLFTPFMHFDAEAGGKGGDGREVSSSSSSLPLVQFDVALFNPPYVPTDMEELSKATLGHDILTAAWCGGPRGRVVVDRFLQQVFRVLKPIPTVVVERRRRRKSGEPSTIENTTECRKVATGETVVDYDYAFFPIGDECGAGSMPSAPPAPSPSPAGLLYLVAIRENEVQDLCQFTNDCFCDADSARVEAEKQRIGLVDALPRRGSGGGEAVADDTQEKEAEVSATVLGAVLACNTVVERWTGEYLSIIKFEMMPENPETDTDFGDSSV